MAKKPPLTPGQVDLLRRFAAHNGRHWKSALRSLWEYGGNAANYFVGSDFAELYGLRNLSGFGPSSLDRFRLPKGSWDKPAVPRAWTEEECRDKFLDVVRSGIETWINASGKTDAEKVAGIAFTILAILDGDSAAVPGFIVTPNPDPDDKAYHLSRGENWWPDDVDVAGGLHEHLGR